MKNLILLFVLLNFNAFAEDDVFSDEDITQEASNKSGKIWKSPSMEDIERAIQDNPLVIAVNKAASGPDAQMLVMYENGKVIMREKVSTGREKEEVSKSGRKYFSETPLGFFRPTKIYQRYYSKTWQVSIQNPVFFDGGTALHGTTRSHYAALGTRDSGGCVRMMPAISEKIRMKVMEMGRGRRKRDYEIDKSTRGRLEVSKNWVSVDKISRKTGLPMKTKIQSWDVVIVIYENEGAGNTAPSK